ncbi:hypothetical protein [Flavobacterium sp.]|uniref:hypothetical protein n=1 Tax=Flavobacterium sp. TaxID=239 RepID=UPI003918A97B
MGKIILFFLLFLIFHISVFSQNDGKKYILHLRGEAQDTLVYEMELNNDKTFENRKYFKKTTDTISNYKKWMVDIRKGTFKKEKGFFRLTQMDGDQCLNGALIRIVFGQIWFYSQTEKDGKVRRCRLITYHRASL